MRLEWSKPRAEVLAHAASLGFSSIRLRGETERVETGETGWNQLVGVPPQATVFALRNIPGFAGLSRPDRYGDGHAAERIVDVRSRGLVH